MNSTQPMKSKTGRWVGRNKIKVSFFRAIRVTKITEHAAIDNSPNSSVLPRIGSAGRPVTNARGMTYQYFSPSVKKNSAPKIPPTTSSTGM